MNPETFLHSLHFDADKARPLNWEVDWADKPYAYKLYRGLPTVELSPDLPLTLEARTVSGKPVLREVGHFLWYVYGLTQLCQSVFPLESQGQAVTLLHTYRRFVPSGGALYPNELYLYLKVEDLATGVYHYDVAHHRLVLLREGNFDSFLGRALGSRCNVEGCFGTVLVTTRFWKNFFKYHNFSYRLQGLDAGILIGQLLEVGKRFGYETGVFFGFLDRAVNHLLGISELEESVYAVIPLTMEPAVFTGGTNGKRMLTATELCSELPSVRHQFEMGSSRVGEFPMLIRMNEACLLESLQFVRPIGGETPHIGESRAIPLPRVERLSYDLAAVCRKRYSPDMDFVLEKISQTQLSELLLEVLVSFPYRNDLDGVHQQRYGSRVFLNVCCYGVEGIPDGAYRYDNAAHALLPVRPGDHRRRLQEGMSLNNVNLHQVPLCFHVAGGRDHLTARLGYRGYRVQQMEAGMLVQRLLLAASASGMGGHPILGYDVNSCDDLYKLVPQGNTNLIQIPLGPYRPRPRLSGSLHG